MTKLIAINTDAGGVQWVNPDQVQRVQSHNQAPDRAVIHFSSGTSLVCSESASEVAEKLSS